ncbi:MAG: alpha/beta hydrolase [Chitinophagaceae bacterium]|nr:alpha/beta hydrolase [Chitinophagaceae bacterium]
MQKVYFISGLGADARAFSLLDLSFCEPVFVNWITPLPKESLDSYAQRMMEQISDSDATIVGLSFGGMLASSMAAKNPTLKVIVLASNKCAAEFPTCLRFGKYFPVYNWMPNGFYKQRGNIKHWLFGARSPEAKKVFAAIQQDSDPETMCKCGNVEM